jgi:Domain of unknown function (DUF4349)
MWISRSDQGATPLRKRQIVAVTALGGLLSALAVAGCSASNDNGGSGGSADALAARGEAAAPAAKPTPPGVVMADGFDSASDGSGTSGAGGSPTNPQTVVVGPALIKTAAIDLKADDIQAIIDKVYGLALTTGGRVDSEQTSTDDQGTVDHSRIQLRVPVATFDDAVSRIYNLARDHTKDTSTEDVTARLADVTSRVESARASITQLRQLFDRATALGQIIRLERELSSREANLEALEAQQRSLAAQTAMSTILVTIALPPKVAAPAKDSDHQAGFVSGIKKGWDAMVTFVVGASHTFGLVLPLGALAALAGLGLWPLIRRLSPRRPGAPQPSE